MRACVVYMREVASREARYRVAVVREARQRAHDLGGSEHADVCVGLQEPARRHRHVGRAHPAPRCRHCRADRAGHAGWRRGRGGRGGRGRRTGGAGRRCAAVGLAGAVTRALSRPIHFLVTSQAPGEISWSHASVEWLPGPRQTLRCASMDRVGRFVARNSIVSLTTRWVRESLTYPYV